LAKLVYFWHAKKYATDAAENFIYFSAKKHVFEITRFAICKDGPESIISKNTFYGLE
jgi:hypothetical protein